MKNNFKFFIFTIFTILFISVANASYDHFLYMIDQASESSMPTLVDCIIDPADYQDFITCGNSYYNAYKYDGVRAIAISPRGYIAYIATGAGLQICSIDDDNNGQLADCKFGSPLDEPEGKVLALATDPYGSWLYYLTRSTLGVCTILGSGKYSDCHTIKSNLMEPTSLAISPGGGYVYITLRETSSVLTCVLEFNKFYWDPVHVGDCTNNENIQQFVSPNGVFLNYSNYVYIVDGQSPAGVAKSCQIADGGKSLGKCNGYIPLPDYTSGATSITLNQRDRPGIYGKYSYIAFPKQHAIVSCIMESGAYTNCKSIKKMSGASPVYITYR